MTKADDNSSQGGVTAVLYVRVSTKEQAERDGDPEGYSIPAQREACTRKAKSLEAVVIEEFVDRGESARTSDRPELQRLLEFVEANPVTYVIVHKIDRLARNRADDVTINLALQNAGVQLVSVTENIDETPSGMLMHGIMSSIAEFYSRNLANEVIKGSVQKAKSGGTPGKAPTGYLNVRKTAEGQEVRTVEIDPERGPLMAWAFEAYATGDWTIRNLLEELTARGLTSVPRPKMPSKPLGIANLHRLLQHPYYKGVVRYRGVLYEGKHPALVTPETWNKVQEVLASNSLSGEKRRVHPHYLKGSVFCGECGSRLVVSHAKGRRGGIYPYFICMGRQRKSTSCAQQAIRIEQTEDAVADLYGTYRLTKEEADEVRDFILEELIKLRAEAGTERERHARRLRGLEGERKKLLDAHYADAIPLDLLKSEQARISADITGSAARLAALDCDFTTAEGNLTKALSFIRDCEGAYRDASDKVRRQFNQAFFKRILIDDSYSAIAELAEPFDLLLSREVREAATRRSEAHLAAAVDDAMTTFDFGEGSGPGLELAGVGAYSESTAGWGLKKETMVGAKVSGSMT